MVFQSFRRTDVPDWIASCLESVAAWCERNAFEYRFIDDEFFDCVPSWFKERVGHAPVPMSDFARLDWAKRLLTGNVDRVIWVDADVVVFDPQCFVIDDTLPFAFCTELWIDRLRGGRLRVDRRINNAVSVYTRGNTFLDYYHFACLQLARNPKLQLGKISFGTQFLMGHRAILGSLLLDSVGMVSPPMLQSLAAGESNEAEILRRDFLSAPVFAANLCASFRNEVYAGISMQDSLYSAALKTLVGQRTAGRDVNAAYRPRHRRILV